MLKDSKEDWTQQAMGYSYPKCEVAMHLRAVYYGIMRKFVCR